MTPFVLPPLVPLRLMPAQRHGNGLRKNMETEATAATTKTEETSRICGWCKISPETGEQIKTPLLPCHPDRLTDHKINQEYAIVKNASWMLKWPTKGYGRPFRVVGFQRCVYSFLRSKQKRLPLEPAHGLVAAKCDVRTHGSFPLVGARPRWS